MASVVVRCGLSSSRLSTANQLVILGKQKWIKALTYESIAAKFKDEATCLVDRATFTAAQEQITTNAATSVPLYLNFAQVSLVTLVERCDVLATVSAISRCFPLYSRKTGETPKPQRLTVELVLVGENSDDSLSEAELVSLQAVCDGVRLNARLVDCPCNELHTSAFVNEAITVADLLGPKVQCAVIQGDELRVEGFGGLYNVGKAATHPPAFVRLGHLPERATKTYAIVGKGIVFDTGGMQIKTKAQMPGMKRDMGGAAATLSAFYALVTAGFKENLHCLLCLAENTVSPTANLPDDIIKMLSGKTVEINNTDAEGRLVLGDGVCYAKNVLKADVIIDLATLTGAQQYASGRLHACLLTNNERCEREMVEAGRHSGDLIHPLPFCPDLFFPDLKSAVADMKNSNLGTMQGPPSAVAAMFIGAQIEFGRDIEWMHVDLAAPVLQQNGERATGYGTALLVSLLGKHTDIPVLQGNH